MSYLAGPLSCFSAMGHLAVQHPLAACAALVIAGASAMAPEPAEEPVKETVLVEEIVFVLPSECDNAPTITDDDIFRVSGDVHHWRNSGVDPVRGNPAGPYLQQLEYTDEEIHFFLQEYLNDRGTKTTLENGTVVGRSTSGSGKLYENTVVAFNPQSSSGEPGQPRDNRMNVYQQTTYATYEGQCVTRTVTLYEPYVCQNWSRPDDVISVVEARAVTTTREVEVTEQEES